MASFPEYEKLLKASQQLLELQEDFITNKTTEVNALKAEIAALRDNSAFIATLKRDREFLRDAEGNAYCVRCALVDKKVGRPERGTGRSKRRPDTANTDGPLSRGSTGLRQM